MMSSQSIGNALLAKATKAETHGRQITDTLTSKTIADSTTVGVFHNTTHFRNVREHIPENPGRRPLLTQVQKVVVTTLH
jgi:hypothetical protein